MASLSLKHIYKVYPNGFKAVNDFNIEIEDKEFIVLVGPSGCGKSTTLRMIAGLEEITAGEMKIADQVVNGMEPKDRDIAMVFQNYALYPHMTIYENIAFGLRMRHVDKDEIDRRVLEAASILGITDYLYKKPKEMSGGQRQRVALGRAIVREPKVMLLDEPLSNLDAKLRTQMRSEIVKLHNKLKTTFIYVTHDQVEAMTMGSRIVVMKDGFVKQIDTPKNLYMHPANKFVAGFIGTPQMNFFNVTLKREGDMVIIVFVDASVAIKAPYSALMKAKTEYLNGDRVVTLGIRPEDLSIVADDLNTIKLKVSHTEELGTETLVYGDIKLENNEFSESNTRLILKDTGFKSYEYDGVYNVRLNPLGIHLFDSETEESIMPLIPEYNLYDVEISNGKMSLLGFEVKLPRALEGLSGKYELRLSPRAYRAGKSLSGVVKNQERVGNEYLLTLDVNGSIMYLISKNAIENSEISFDLDYKSLSFAGVSNVEALPLEGAINGSFIMENKVETITENEKARKKHYKAYSLLINGVSLSINDEIATKMCQSFKNREVFNTSFRYSWSAYDMSIASTGLEGRVLEYLDYGMEKFLKLMVYDEIFYVAVDKEYSGVVHIMPNLDKTGVLELKRNIRII